MTASAQSSEEKKVTTLDDYFRFENTAEGRHEFMDGKIVAE